MRMRQVSWALSHLPSKLLSIHLLLLALLQLTSQLLYLLLQDPLPNPVLNHRSIKAPALQFNTVLIHHLKTDLVNLHPISLLGLPLYQVNISATVHLFLFRLSQVCRMETKRSIFGHKMSLPLFLSSLLKVHPYLHLKALFHLQNYAIWVLKKEHVWS